MIKNEDNKNLFNDKLISIFDWNIPRKINFNSFVSNSGNSLNERFYNDKTDKIKISKFNPYDTEIDKKSKYNINERKVNNQTDNYNNTNLIYFGFNSGEKNENKNNENNILINKINKYIYISSDEENNKNNNFITPKLNIKNKNEYMKLTQYSTNNNNKKDISYTDLKNGLTNMKVKSTNFSSNISYDSYDKNENININTNLYSNFHSKKDKDKHNLHKVTFINLNPNNKIKKSKLYDNTLIDNKIKSNTNVENRKHKIPKLKSIKKKKKKKKDIICRI